MLRRKAKGSSDNSRLRGRIKSKIREKLKLRTLIIITIAAAIFLITFRFYQPITSWLDSLIIAYGLTAIMVISFVSDATPQPIGPELPIITGIALGFPAVLTLTVAIAASGFATILNYYIGAKYGKSSFSRFYSPEEYQRLINKSQQYNEWLIPIAAFTPVPYVPACWIAGMLRMNKVKYFLYAMIPRSVRLALAALFAVGIN